MILNASVATLTPAHLWHQQRKEFGETQAESDRWQLWAPTTAVVLTIEISGSEMTVGTPPGLLSAAIWGGRDCVVVVGGGCRADDDQGTSIYPFNSLEEAQGSGWRWL